MFIRKPQKISSERLKHMKIKDFSEQMEYCIFEREEDHFLKEQEIDFEHCQFRHFSSQYAEWKNVTFSDTIFVNCDFSNSRFIHNCFVQCEFRNCKMTGCDFSENRFYHVSFVETNANYLNLSMASLENVLFQNTQARNSYFQETKMKQIYFETVDLTQAQFFKTSLNGVDLSSSKIEQIAVSIEDIKGAIIEQFQAVELLYLLGVKIKK